MGAVRKPEIIIQYEGSNAQIEGFLRSFALKLTFRERLNGGSPELTVRFRDEEGKFRGGTFTDVNIQGLGDTWEAWIHWEGIDEFLYCGKFRTDRFDWGYSPDEVIISGLGTDYQTGIENYRNPTQLTNVNFEDIITTIAQNYPTLTLIDSYPAPDPAHSNFTLGGQSDLQLLTSLADEYNFAFYINESQLFFNWIPNIELGSPSFTMTKNELEAGVRFLVRNDVLYEYCEVYYGTPPNDAWLRVRDNNVSNNRYLTFPGGTEPGLASMKAVTSLQRTNSERNTARIRCEGDLNYRAGKLFTLQGFDNRDGKWLIEEATHTVDMSRGWLTEMMIRKVEPWAIVGAP